MNRETVFRILGFVDELEKEAAMPWLSQASSKMPGLGARVAKGVQGALENRFGRQLLVGGALGGGVGYLTGDEDTRVRNALYGAGAGAGLAGARILASPTARQELGKQLGRTGKRLRYQLTGTGLSKNPAAAEAQAQELGILAKSPDAPKPLPSWAPPSVRKAYDRTMRQGQRLQEAHELERKTFHKGEMHAPGIFKSMVTHPGEFFKRQWDRNPMLMKVFTGYGLYGAGKGLTEKPEEGGPGRFEKALNATGQTAGWLASPHGFFPGLAVAPVLGKGLGMVGRRIDTAAGTRAPGPTTSNAGAKVNFDRIPIYTSPAWRRRKSEQPPVEAAPGEQ